MSCCELPPPPPRKGVGLCGGLQIVQQLENFKMFRFGDGAYPVYRICPEKGLQLVRYHTEEAHEGSIFLGCASVALSAGWHVASRGNLSPLTQTHKRLYLWRCV